jgi:MFS family permease
LWDDDMTGAATTLAEARLWTGPYARVVAGLFVLALLEGFESMAVTTAMPAVARDLHALGAIALAFSTPIAVSVVSRAVAGDRMDRHGPAGGLRLGVALFVVGLVVAGTAPSMAVFLVGRGIQGFAMGFVGVGLYVVIGRVFPDHLRTRVFTVLTSAWVVPALLGPGVAGLVTELVGWRWVFLGVPPLALGALALVWSALDAPALDDDATGAAAPADTAPPTHPRPRTPPRPTTGRRAIGWSLLLAAALLATSIVGQGGVPFWPLLLVAAVGLVGVSAPRLLPRRTWSGGRGLPSIMGARSLVAAGYFGAETYLPLSLVEHHGLSLTAAGAFLTASALLWFGGSWLCAHAAWLAPKPRRVRVGSLLVVVGIAAAAASVWPTIPLIVVAIGWGLCGLGMGMSNPTFSVMLLDASTATERGVNSAAMQTNDVVVQSLVLALGAVVFAALLATAPAAGFLLAFALAATAAALGAALIGRVQAA